ncbi:MAG TPA: YdcF family protein [Kiloniellaceae bacterium]|nr:YdcF family protein [Kiloniellaceae bacterium]
MTRGLLTGFLLLFAFWLGGLLWFAGAIPRAVEDATSKTDTIVVLTGGSDRLSQGLALLSEGRAEKLFVSGVYRGIEVRELLDLVQDSPSNLECCVAIGYEADNTRGNALETADWIAEQGYGSLRLVTANYHMPRSLLEFRRVLPDIEIIAHPVFPETYHQEDWWRWPGSTRLLISEYDKYLLALLLALLESSR